LTRLFIARARIQTESGKADPNKPFAGGDALKFSGASSLSVSIMSVVLIIGTSIIALLV